MFQATFSSDESPGAPTSHENAPFYNVISISPSLSLVSYLVQPSSPPFLSSISVSPSSSSTLTSHVPFDPRYVHYVPHVSSLVPVSQSESLASTESSYSMSNSLILNDISSCRFVPQGFHLVYVSSSFSMYESRVKTSSHIPSTHPMMTRSKSSLEALTSSEYLLENLCISMKAFFHNSGLVLFMKS